MESNTSPYLNAQDTRLLSTEQSVFGKILPFVVFLFPWVDVGTICCDLPFCLQKLTVPQYMQIFLFSASAMVFDRREFWRSNTSSVTVSFTCKNRERNRFKKSNKRRRKACAVWQREKWDEKE